MLTITKWINFEIINMELSVAKMHGAQGKTITFWAEALSQIELLQVVS